MSEADRFDVLIAGGGLVGASLAHALAGSGLRTAMIEARAYAGEPPPSYDDRAIALAYGSRRIFEGLGLWDELRGQAGPIRKIHVSDRGRFAFSHLDADEMQVDALGYVVPARAIGGVLYRVLQADVKKGSGVEIVAPAEVQSLARGDGRISVEVRQDGAERHLSGRLLVVADGGESRLRDQLGVPVRRLDYEHIAVVANVSTERAPDGVAFERFTEQGPLALLPLADGNSALVYTAPAADREHLLGLDDQAFLRLVQDRFGQRLGRFTRIGRRDSYPLKLIKSDESVRERALIIGNAAHTLHPIAGQGFNLGLRDVATLADLLVEAGRAGGDPGAAELLNRYARARRRDQQSITWGTDLLARVFANPLPPLRLARGLGMLGLNVLPGARRRLTRAAMGLSGTLPRLARGLPLA